MIRSGFWALAALLIAGCTSAKAPSDGTQFRSDQWPLVVASGFAIAPPLAQPGVTRPDEAVTLFADELYAALLFSMPTTDFRAPSQTLGLLDERGPRAHARLRSLCDKLARDEQLLPEDLAAISRDVEHRFLLVGWILEGASDVSVGTGRYFFDSGIDGLGNTESDGMEPLTHQQVNGRSVAAILDLREGEVLWRGTVEYHTLRKDSENDALADGLDRARMGAAIRLADSVGEY